MRGETEGMRREIKLIWRKPERIWRESEGMRKEIEGKLIETVIMWGGNQKMQKKWRDGMK
jgi:hypothetical protein